MVVTGFVYILGAEIYNSYGWFIKAKDAPWDAVPVGSVVRTVGAKLIIKSKIWKTNHLQTELF
jgi:hypothetical protein